MSAQRSHWFTWSPTGDTLVAVLTEIAMIAAYWTTAHLLGFGWDVVRLIILLIWGLFYAVVFRMTSNLLTVWPLLWCVGSSMGTLMGGMQFTWSQIATWSVILLIQLGFIGYTWWRQ